MDAAAFGILGRTALRIAGKIDEDWGPPRLRAMLAALLVHAPRPVPIDTLIDWCWPEESPPLQSPASTFHTYATRIRKSLSRVRPDVALLGKDGSYRLTVARAEIDCYHFRDLMAQARTVLRQGQAILAKDLALRAIGLWRGRPLEDLRTARARDWRLRFETDDWLPANTALCEALSQLGEHNDALSRVDDLLGEHPHDLSLAKVRMAALHGLGRYEDVTNYYLAIYRWMRTESDLQAADHIKQFHDNLVGSQRPALTRANAMVAPRQLPHDVPEFVGRADLLRELDVSTTTPSGEPRGGVVILDGMAGVGKSALAVHWGHLARHRFPDGDFFVNLNGFSDSAIVPPSRVVDDFLIALGHPPDKNLDQRSRELLLSGLLTGRQALVVLDNARNTDHVKDLIALLPNCLIIVTSRQRLTMLSATTASRRVRVEPMPATEATELLSVLLGPHRNIDGDDRDRLIQLCGGLPLVIKVLADHVAMSGIGQPSAFARQLDRRQLIVDIGEDGEGAAIANTFFSWSYQRLAPDEQRLFRLLGLHTGPEIGVDVACACDGRTPEETKRSFGKLVSSHLLERPDPGENRHRFHDLLREFAAYRVEMDEPTESRRAAERRMLCFYLRSAADADRVLYPNRITPPELPIEEGVEALVFTTPTQAKSWFNQERTNLAAAVRFATTRGHHDHAWRLADAVVIFFDRHGYYEDSRAILEHAVTSARAAGHRDGELSSLDGLGKVCMILGDNTEAQRCLDLALQYATAEDHEQALAATLHQLGRLRMRRGDPTGAVDLYRRCLDIAERIDDLRNQCWTHARIGEALRMLDQHEPALVHLHRTEYFARRLGDQSALASSMATIGSVLHDRGDHHAAHAYAVQALAISEAIPDLAITVQACTTLAEIDRARGDAAAATRHARYAVEVCQRIRSAPDEARACEVLADIEFANGAIAEAVAAWTHAAGLYESTGNPTRSALIKAKIADSPAGEVIVPTARPDSPAPNAVGAEAAGDRTVR